MIMKRLSRSSKAYSLRIKSFREACIIKKNRKILLRRSRNYSNNIVEITLKMPVYINIFNIKTRKWLKKVTTKLRDYYYRENLKICFDFSKTKVMNCEGTLYLLAELDTLTLTNPSITFDIIPSQETVVNQVLEQTGILKLLKQTKLKLNRDDFDESVKYWRYASGYNSEIESEESNLMLDAFERMLSKTDSQSIFTSLTEAFTNSHHHAYEAKRYPSQTKIVKKWWLFSQEKGDELTVCVCDLGIGIPRSLTIDTPNVKKQWFIDLREFLFKHKEKFDSDSASIKAAVEIGNTRTSLPNRGKGLPQIIEKINTACDNKASIAIFSNKGSYIINRGYVLDRPKTDIINGFSIPYTESIDGTLIVWQIPIDPEFSESTHLVETNE